MKKRLFILLLALAVGTSMIGCSSKDDPTQDTNTDTEIEDVVNSDSDLDLEDETIDSETPNVEDADENTSDIQKPTDKPVSKPPVTKPDTGDDTNSDSNNSATLTGTLEDIMAGLYTTTGFTDLNTCNTDINAENISYYLGVNNIKIKQGIASEPLISSKPHSVVLIELEDSQDISKVKTDIKNNVDGYKWVCVGVEPENILVDNIGNFVLLVMDENSKAIMDAFKALEI